MTEPDQQHPPDPISGIAEAAVGIHVTFRSLVDAGFTEPQALYLTGVLVSAQLRGPGTT